MLKTIFFSKSAAPKGTVVSMEHP